MILFILKLKSDYGCYSYGVSRSGLYNSARFVVDMLNESGIKAKLVQVVDSNDIDREVHKHKPTHVFIEALWVPPAKFDELFPLHPSVKWTVRIHSESPFLSQEGIATEWIRSYLARGIQVGFNSLRITRVFEDLFSSGIKYFPNYFPVTDNKIYNSECKDHIDIGCFGAIRVLKNQYNQALAAIEYGKRIRKPIHFHINNSFHGCTTGSNVYRNLKALFAGTENTLVEHGWQSEYDFEKLVRNMDIGMQVSISESFNIVAAQMVNCMIPVVVSPEISWVSESSMADPTSVEDISNKLKSVTGFFRNHIARKNISGLTKFSHHSRQIWLSELE